MDGRAVCVFIIVLTEINRTRYRELKENQSLTVMQELDLELVDWLKFSTTGFKTE